MKLTLDKKKRFKIFPKWCRSKSDQVSIQSKASIFPIITLESRSYFCLLRVKTPFVTTQMFMHCEVKCQRGRFALCSLFARLECGKNEGIPFVRLINRLQCRCGIHSLNITNEIVGLLTHENRLKTGSNICNCLFSHFIFLFLLFTWKEVLFSLCPTCEIIDTFGIDF